MNTNSSEIDLGAVSAALKAVKHLRCSISDLFNSLADGSGGDLANEASDISERLFLKDIENHINSVSLRIRELESSCSLLSLSPSSAHLHLANTTHLAQDPSYEKTSLYTSLIASYRWTDKLQEFSSSAHLLLNQNPLRRCVQGQTSLYMRPRFPGGPVPRRLTYIGHNIPSTNVDNFLQSIQRLSSDMHFEILRPFGSPTILKVTLERVFRAIILLRGLLIEWVVVKGLSENFETEDGKLDIWSESRYDIFRKISDHANAAMLHFSSPFHVDIAIRSFITWLHSYITIFSKPCRKCESRLLNGMPPTWRDFRTLESYHEICRP